MISPRPSSFGLPLIVTILGLGLSRVFAVDDATAAPPSPNSAELTNPANTGPTLRMPSPAVPAADAPDPLPSATSSPVENVSSEGANAASSSPSQNVTVNLINLMVKRGLISTSDAEALIRQAEQEAASAKATATSSAPGETSEAASSGSSAAQPANSDDEVAVNYVPDVVRNQIRDDVKASVMKEARDEHWGGQDSNLPDWVHRFHINGDIRVRVEGDYFPAGNDDTGGFPNFNAINTGSPFDTSAISNPRLYPTFDVDQTRYRPRIRARIGADIDLNDNFTAGIRAGTGQDDSPTTENQTIGLANQGQGGDFSKYAVWLDRAFIRYDNDAPGHNFEISVGRFDNPFLSSSMIWADEIGFDGIAAKGSYEVTDGVKPFLTAGFFPVFNTDFNFASNQAAKFRSEDKWLYAAQLGVSWQVNKDFNATGAAALYYFQNVAGQLSSPFTPLSTADAGDTDDSRPSFAQNGNTYRELRDIVPTAANDFGAIDQFQYYGLATGFEDVALTGKLDYGRFDPFHLQLLGEFVDNLAFDQNSINALAVNNRGSGGTGTFAGGNQGFNVRFTLGQPVLLKRWDWNVTLTYRYVESDATIDGFTDADFGGPLVGTNLQGYIISGYLALTPHITTDLRFMSADSIAGPTYHNDLFQLDLNAKF